MPINKSEAADLSPTEKDDLAAVEAVIDREIGLHYVWGVEILVRLHTEAQSNMGLVFTERLRERVREDYRRAGWRVSVDLLSSEGEGVNIRLW